MLFASPGGLLSNLNPLQFFQKEGVGKGASLVLLLCVWYS